MICEPPEPPADGYTAVAVARGATAAVDSSPYSSERLAILLLTGYPIHSVDFTFPFTHGHTK